MFAFIRLPICHFLYTFCIHEKLFSLCIPNFIPVKNSQSSEETLGFQKKKSLFNKPAVHISNSATSAQHICICILTYMYM